MEGQPKALSADAAYAAVDPASLGFDTTSDLDPYMDGVGQPRAIEAIEFGTKIKRDGYNLFAFGDPGVGRHFLVRSHLEALAASIPAAEDWCYVNNFVDSRKPEAISLPTGTVRVFSVDMEKFVEDLRVAIPGAFDSENYRERRQSIDAEIQERQEAAFQKLHAEATAAGAALVRTPMGFAVAPVADGKVIEPAKFHALPEEKQEEIRKTVAELEKKLEEIVRHIPAWHKEHAEKIHELNREVTTFAVAYLIDPLKQKYAGIAEIGGWLDRVRADIIDNAELFWRAATESEVPQNPLQFAEPPYERYRVNVIVDNPAGSRAPVVFADHPTFAKLFGRIEHESRFGNLITDYRMIRGGCLHEANGGFLIADVRELLMQPMAWETLKRSLKTGRIEIESIGEALGYGGLATLEPEPIPLDLKVVLVGDQYLYHMMAALDPDVQRLFKVAVDFDGSFERNPESERLFARFIAGLIVKADIRPMNAPAVARLIEHASRTIEDTKRLSLNVGIIQNLLYESDHWASAGGKKIISRTHVDKAIRARKERLDRIRLRSLESVTRDIHLIETRGRVTGQINGLSVLSIGEISFGKPSRITANVRLGRGEVIDIERQVELGGALHSKGVLILSGFLGEKFGQDRPLAVSASIVFEQSYGGVDGDSASAAELVALLSALSDRPIDQALAITGSVNQKGRIQAIGGVNEKIEGFFDICRERRLTGKQGVLIPSANVQHLMLRDDVVEAIRKGRFSIYPVDRIEECVALMMDAPAGEPDRKGAYPAATVYGDVVARLDEYAALARKQAPQGGSPSSSERNSAP